MRTLKELGAFVASDSMRRYFEKRANIITPMAFGMGLQVPQIAHDAQKRYLDMRRQLALAATTNLGERIASDKTAARQYIGRTPPSTGLEASRSPSGRTPSMSVLPEGFNLTSSHVPELRHQALEDLVSDYYGNEGVSGGREHSRPEKGTGGTSFFQDLGKKTLTKVLSDTAVKGIGGLANMAYSAWKQRNFGPARDAILADLKKNDPIVSRGSEETIADAMTSMIRFAPVLSTDKNAVRSYLREAIMSGAGPNYSTIKSLADAENTVTGKD